MVTLQKKQVKIISVLIALVFVGSVVALALTQSGSGIASAASSNVGVVDYRQIAQQSSQLQDIQSQMQKEVQDAQKEFEEKSANMSDQEKNDYYQQTQQRLAQKNQELMEPFQKSIEDSVKSVAEAKGLSVVLEKSSVVYGGQDITQDVINQTKSESLVGSFVDTAAAAAEVGKICNAHNSIDIDFTVLLTHIGFEEDKHLARQLDPAWGVDLIIGGHSHTLPEHAVEENGVIIAQAGTGTDQIGRFDIIVDTDNNCIDSYTWRTVPICADTCPRNPAMEQVLHRFTSQVDEKYSHIVGRFRRELTHPERTRETELGNLFADIFTRSLGIDIMLIGSGSIRAEKLGPIVTYGDLIEGFPYDDGVFMFKVTGRQLRQMLHYMLREEAYTGHTEFYQLPSTLRLRYDRAKGDFDYFTYCGKEVGKEISDDALFTVGLQNYHFKNIESFFNISYDTICKLQKPRSVATSCQDILMEYFREHEMLDAVVDGRMTILAPDGTAR